MVWVLLFAALISTGAAQTPDWQAQGQKAFDEKRYEAAADAFRKAAAADSKDFYSHFQLALTLSILKQDAEAITEYQKTLELKPDLYEAQLNAGMVMSRTGRFAEAVPLLEKAALEKPREFLPRLYLADAQASLNHDAQAVDAYHAALGIDGKSADAEAGLARVLGRQGKIDEAAEHYQKAAALDPAYRNGLLDLASLYEKNGRTAEAVKIYEQFPDHPAAKERAASLMIDSGNIAGAIPELEKAVQKAPTTANRINLIKAYIHEKQSEKAVPVLVAAIQADPKNYELRMVAGRMLRDMRKFPDAANQFFGATQLKADSVEAWNELSGALIMAEKYPEALGALDRVKALGGETAAHHYFRAIVLDKLHQVEPALKSYQTFLEMSHDQRPDEEFKARQRVRILQRELSKK